MEDWLNHGQATRHIATVQGPELVLGPTRLGSSSNSGATNHGSNHSSSKEDDSEETAAVQVTARVTGWQTGASSSKQQQDRQSRSPVLTAFRAGNSWNRSNCSSIGSLVQGWKEQSEEQAGKGLLGFSCMPLLKETSSHQEAPQPVLCCDMQRKTTITGLLLTNQTGFISNQNKEQYRKQVCWLNLVSCTQLCHTFSQRNIIFTGILWTRTKGYCLICQKNNFPSSIRRPEKPEGEKSSPLTLHYHIPLVPAKSQYAM